MGSSVEQQVIDFTASYTSTGSSSINSATTLASLGIPSGQDTIEYMMELEDSFEITYEEGDADGIITVGDAVAFITAKLGG